MDSGGQFAICILQFAFCNCPRSHALRGNARFATLCVGRIDAERRDERVPTRSMGTRVQKPSALRLSHAIVVAGRCACPLHSPLTTLHFFMAASPGGALALVLPPSGNPALPCRLARAKPQAAPPATAVAGRFYPLSTLHSQLSTLNSQLTTIHYPLSTIHYPLSTIH